MKKLILALLIALPLAVTAQSIFSYWAIQHQPAATTAATIGAPALPYGRHVAKYITACTSGVAAQPTIVVNLRDGGTGAGTILWSSRLSAAAGTSQCIHSNVDIIGSTNTIMTLETAAAPASTNFATVALGGYDLF